MTPLFTHKSPTPEPDDDPLPPREPDPIEDPVPHPDPVIKPVPYPGNDWQHYQTRRIDSDWIVQTYSW